MSTMISELPTQGQGFQNPINQGNQNQPQGMNPNIVNQLLNDINEAAIKGETSLPTRDIPMQTNIDETAIPNYVPEKGGEFIQEDTTNYIQNYNRRALRDERLDKIYDEIQTPLLLAILYFLFQLPIVRNTMFKLFPFMFSKDGNSNIRGYFGFSLFFGLSYYVINKLMIIANF